MAALRANSLKTVLARCMPSDLKNIAKFQVKKMEFDQNLNMVRWYGFTSFSTMFLWYNNWTILNQHFAKHETVFAFNNEDVCKPGDIVLIGTVNYIKQQI
jgi:hypothetical protein